MTDRVRVWGGTDSARVLGLLANAPVSMALLEGSELRVEAADDGLFDGLLSDGGGRERVRQALGDALVEAIDRVRTDGRPQRATCLVGERLWEVWLARVDAELVGLYGMPVEDGAPVRTHLHAIRNSLYGIRAAAGVLLRRDVDDGTRDVLEQVIEAARDAEARVADVEACR